MLNDPVVFGNKSAILEAWEGFEPLFATFISSTDTASIQDDDFIANTPDGYLLELLKCGQADAAMGTGALITAPYTTRLRAVTDVSLLGGDNKKVFLTKAIYRAFDVTLTGNVDQDTDTLDAIEGSLTTMNDAYVQSRFRFAEIGGWEPNYFHPHLAVRSSTNIFQTLSSSNFGKKSNKGDLSIGRSLPFCYEPPIPILLKGLKNVFDALQVYAMAGQWIDGKIQRYPVLAEFEFIGTV